MTISGTLCLVRSTTRSARSGASYVSSTPATPLSSPRRAAAYTPLRSVASQCSSGVAMWIVKKFPPGPAVDSTVSLMASREAALGAMGAAMTAAPARASSAETYPSRCRSFDLSSADFEPATCIHDQPDALMRMWAAITHRHRAQVGRHRRGEGRRCDRLAGSMSPAVPWRQHPCPSCAGQSGTAQTLAWYEVGSSPGAS